MSVIPTKEKVNVLYTFEPACAKEEMLLSSAQQGQFNFIALLPITTPSQVISMV